MVSCRNQKDIAKAFFMSNGKKKSGEASQNLAAGDPLLPLSGSLLLFEGGLQDTPVAPDFQVNFHGIAAIVATGANARRVSRLD